VVDFGLDFLNLVMRIHSHPTGRLSLERKNGLVLS